VKHEREKRKCKGKTVAEKVEVIREADKKEASKNGIAHAYGIPLSTLSVFLKNWNSVEQAVQKVDVSKWMRIHGAKHGRE
jgi:hypothetical protein